MATERPTRGRSQEAIAVKPDPEARDVSIPADYWRLEFDLPPRQPAPHVPPEAELPVREAAFGGAFAVLLGGLASLEGVAHDPQQALDDAFDRVLQTLQVAIDSAPEKLADLFGV